MSRSIVIPATPQEAWPVLTSWEAQARWMRDADSVRVLTPHREGAGVRIAVRTRVLGIPLFTEPLEVTEWDPPHRLVMAHRALVRGTGTWTLGAAAGGALFTWVEDLSLPIPLLGELALLAYRPFMRRLMRGSMRNLRRMLADQS